MGRKNRNNRFQPQRQHNQSQPAGVTTTQQRPQQHPQNQARPVAPADADIAFSIAALGERIELLKARWADTQTRIETLRQASREVLAEHNVAMQFAVEGGDGVMDEQPATTTEEV